MGNASRQPTPDQKAKILHIWDLIFTEFDTLHRSVHLLGENTDELHFAK